MLDFLFDAVGGLATGVLWFAVTAFWIWMIVECATKERAPGNERLVWLIVTVFVFPVGPFVYYIFRRPERIRSEYRRNEQGASARSRSENAQADPRRPAYEPSGLRRPNEYSTIGY